MTQLPNKVTFEGTEDEDSSILIRGHNSMHNSFLHTQEWNFIIKIFKQHSFDRYFPECQEIWVLKKKRERWVLDSTQPLTTGVNINMGFIWGNEAGIFDPQVAVYLKLCIIFLAVHLKYTSHMASPYCSFLIAVLSEFYSNGVQQRFFKGFKNFASCFRG